MALSSLSEQQIGILRQKLRSQRDKLLEEIRQELAQSANEHYIDLATKVHDSGDESVADLLSDIDIAVTDRHINELREVEAALRRMATTADYGTCSECEGEIAYERLVVHPTAIRCYDCQQRLEQNMAEKPWKL